MLSAAPSPWPDQQYFTVLVWLRTFILRTHGYKQLKIQHPLLFNKGLLKTFVFFKVLFVNPKCYFCRPEQVKHKI
jgi:hypothetical protein